MWQLRQEGHLLVKGGQGAGLGVWYQPPHPALLDRLQVLTAGGWAVREQTLAGIPSQQQGC